MVLISLKNFLQSEKIAQAMERVSIFFRTEEEKHVTAMVNNSSLSFIFNSCV
jgi:hypothetical protein